MATTLLVTRPFLASAFATFEIAMLEDFNRYIAEQQLCKPGMRILVAVSGGMDSMVLADLFQRAGYPIGIAHCNFKMRGDESDGDEAFVKDYAAARNLPFFSQSFQTKDYAAQKGISIQMAARELRYSWFNILLIGQNFNFIATAHHATDLVETVLINMLRGTGLSGMHGILPRNVNVIRPMLFATREEIGTYCLEHKLQFRSDSSNSSDRYLRNKLRHDVLPVFRSVKEGFEKIFLQNSNYIRLVEEYLVDCIERESRQIVTHSRDEWKFDIDELRNHKHQLLVLRQLLTPFGFSHIRVVQSILDSFDRQSGKEFYSDQFKLIKDRHKLIIRPLSQLPKEEIKISGEESLIRAGSAEILVRQVSSESYAFKTSADFACLDMDKLKFPLKLRVWSNGDRFVPIGMTQHKKVSDFLVDAKVPVSEKENQWVLLSGDEIVWVVGRRISDSFKVTGSTKKVYELELLDQEWEEAE